MLQIQDLTIHSKDGTVLLHDVSLSLSQGEALAITGQSGAGKSTLLKAILGLLSPEQRITQGKILEEETDLATLRPAERRALCGTTLGFIPQSPMTAFDPRLTIGQQMTDTIQLRLAFSKQQAQSMALEQLKAVNLSDCYRVFHSKPSQLSGGMLQRVAVALLLALKPKYILADEPTSALDEENRTLLLALLKEQLQHTGILLITHDVDAIRALCQQVIVLHAGKVIEQQKTDLLFCQPKEDWTREFVRCSTTATGGEFRWMAL